MTEQDKELEKLQIPFPAEDIEWRVSRSMSTTRGNKAIVLAYVTNRAIMNRLDEVLGIGGWKNEYKEWRDKGILCGISVKIDGEWITKWDGAEETQFEAVKGGFSGSMKRAAVQWGIGRYLYNLDETWVDVKDKGANYIYDKKSNIKGYWDTPNLPSWALPSGYTKKQKDKNPFEEIETSKETLISKYILTGGKKENFDGWYENQKKKRTNNEIDMFLTKLIQDKKVGVTA